MEPITPKPMLIIPRDESPPRVTRSPPVCPGAPARKRNRAEAGILIQIGAPVAERPLFLEALNGGPFGNLRKPQHPRNL